MAVTPVFRSDKWDARTFFPSLVRWLQGLLNVSEPQHTHSSNGIAKADCTVGWLWRINNGESRMKGLGNCTSWQAGCDSVLAIYRSRREEAGRAEIHTHLFSSTHHYLQLFSLISLSSPSICLFLSICSHPQVFWEGWPCIFCPGCAVLASSLPEARPACSSQWDPETWSSLPSQPHFPHTLQWPWGHCHSGGRSQPEAVQWTTDLRILLAAVMWWLQFVFPKQSADT